MQQARLVQTLTTDALCADGAQHEYSYKLVQTMLRHGVQAEAMH